MQVGRRRSFVLAGAILAIAALALALFWWNRQEPLTERVASAPLQQEASNEVSEAEKPTATGPAADLLNARKPGTRPRATTFITSYDLLPGKAADVVAKLQPLAEAGDSDAAFYLFIKVDECRSHLYRSSGREISHSVSSVEADLVARTPAECHGLTLAQYENNARWLEQAAESGLVMAQLAYASRSDAVVGNSTKMLANPEKVIAFRNKAMRYLHQAASSGSVEGLGALSRAYRYGVLTKKDPVLAYAYYSALGQVDPNLVNERLMATHAAQLNHAQLALATQQGRSIYDVCCKN